MKTYSGRILDEMLCERLLSVVVVGGAKWCGKTTTCARHAKISSTTVKAALSLLKEVGILYRIGGDRGGHWLISWKDAK